MAILPIVMYGHPVLREKSKPVTEADSLRELVEDMFDTMRNAQGIGLAANQVGITKRVLVIDLSPLEQYKDQKPLVMINPQILKEDGEWEMEEGCLSIPAVRDVVRRSETVRVRYYNTDLTEREIEADDILGRVILHEIDHLNGILFIDHLPPGRRKFHKGMLLSIRRGEMEIPYPISGSEEPVM